MTKKGKKKEKIRRTKRSTVWMSLLRYGGAEKLSFTARVSGGFAHSFGNMRKYGTFTSTIQVNIFSSVFRG